MSFVPGSQSIVPVAAADGRPHTTHSAPENLSTYLLFRAATQHLRIVQCLLCDGGLHQRRPSPTTARQKKNGSLDFRSLNCFQPFHSQPRSFRRSKQPTRSHFFSPGMGGSHGEQSRISRQKDVVRFLGPQLGYLADTDGVDGVVDNVLP